jgi:gluconolactonase
MDLDILASGLKFPEGPVAMDDGSVMVVEIQRGTLTRVDPDGSVDVVADCGGGPNGAAVGPDGAMYVCNNGGCFEWTDLGGLTIPGPLPRSWKGGSIQRVDLDSGEAVTLYAECDGRQLRAPNDLVFDRHGGFWFTDHGVRAERSSDRTGVFYAKADGSSITEVIFPLDAPNGVGLSPDGARVYVAETHTGRLWGWDVTGPGVAAADPAALNAGGELLCGLPGMQLFDSLAVDAAGNVCVGTLVNGGITVVAPDGSKHEHVAMPDMLVTNICFGGSDLTTAYVTLSGTGQLGMGQWSGPGLALAHTA